MSPFYTYVIRNFLRRRFLSALVLGMVVFCGLTITTLATLGFSLRTTLIQHALPTRLFVVSENWRDDDLGSSLPKNILERMNLVPGARAWTENLNYLVRSGKNGPETVVLRGLDAIGFEQRGLKVADGTLPTGLERELIVGDAVRVRYPDYVIGSTVRVGNHPWKIVGVFKTGTFDESEIWASHDALDAEFNTSGSVNLALIDVPDVAAVEPQLKNLESMPTDAKVKAMTDAKRKRDDYSHFAPLYTVLITVSVLVTIGTVLSVMMALSLVFSQRTAELSALRAIGFRNMSIGWLVLLESNVFALFGVAIALAASFFLLYGRAMYSGWFVFKMIIRPDVFALSAVVTVVACSLGAIIPLRRVLRLDIPQGLRDE